MRACDGLFYIDCRGLDLISWCVRTVPAYHRGLYHTVWGLDLIKTRLLWSFYGLMKKTSQFFLIIGLKFVFNFQQVVYLSHPTNIVWEPNFITLGVRISPSYCIVCTCYEGQTSTQSAMIEQSHQNFNVYHTVWGQDLMIQCMKISPFYC